MTVRIAKAFLAYVSYAALFTAGVAAGRGDAAFAVSFAVSTVLLRVLIAAAPPEE